MVYDMFGTYCVDITMNERIKELAMNYAHKMGNSVLYNADHLEKFAELIVKECAQLARNTNLEDVEGGDSAVLLAAKHHILDHFGVEE